MALILLPLLPCWPLGALPFSGGGAAPRPTFAQMVAEHADQMAGLKADERPNLPRVKVRGASYVAQVAHAL